MEHAKNIYLVEGNFVWNDLGSWESVYLTDKKDEKLYSFEVGCLVNVGLADSSTEFLSSGDIKIKKILKSHFDFSVEIDVKVNSYIPFVSNFTPTDTLKIYKSGSSLRMDYTLVGYEHLQCKRRDMSCIFNPKDP